MNCHVISAALSLLAKTHPTHRHGFGWTGLRMTNLHREQTQINSE